MKCTVSFADHCGQRNSTSLVSPRGYIALYPRAWRVTSVADMFARRGAATATDCRWTISADRGRRITLFSARYGAHLHRADEVADRGHSSAAAPADRLLCPGRASLRYASHSRDFFSVQNTQF